MDGAGKAKVLIAGGGVAALEAALALRDLAADRVSVELLAPEPHFWYRPLAVVEPFRLGEVRRYELDSLARSIGASLTLGALTGIDAWRHVARTSRNVEIPYDMLLIACGAVPVPAITGAVMFRGPADVDKVERLLGEVEAGAVRSVAFVIPWGAVWSLPAYELALLTSRHLQSRDVGGVELTLVTPELEPLQLFGPPASEAVAELLAANGIGLDAGAYVRTFEDGALELIPEGRLEVERVLALPQLRGAPIDGIPQTVHGFIPVDAHGHVHGLPDVFAAGDITSFTVKQGGIATQQADAAAEAIAAAAGADLTPERFRPVLRGLLLTGREGQYLRRELSGQPEHEPVRSTDPLWWPPAKIVGKYLAPFLAALERVETPPDLQQVGPEALQVEVELDPAVRPMLPAGQLASEGAETDDERVGTCMSGALVVAPEDTLGEVAERLLAEDARAAAVAEYGRLIGIVTLHDLMRAYAARAHPSEARVRTWMTAEPVTVDAETPATAAALLMREYGIQHLLVVEGERPIGTIRLDDIATRIRLPIGLGF